LQEAIDFLAENPDTPTASVARDFGISRTTLKNRISKKTLRRPIPPPLTRFSYAEEKAICRYIDRLDAINLAVRKEFVIDVANTILREKEGKDFEGNTYVGKNWIDRFLKRYGYSLSKQKQLESNRYNTKKPEIISE